MPQMATTELPDVDVLSREDGMRILDEKSQRYLGISGEEFMRRWDDGYYAKDPDRPELIRLAMLLPLVR
jgi:hypothetical protein